MSFKLPFGAKAVDSVTLKPIEKPKQIQTTLFAKLETVSESATQLPVNTVPVSKLLAPLSKLPAKRPWDDSKEVHEQKASKEVHELKASKEEPKPVAHDFEDTLGSVQPQTLKKKPLHQDRAYQLLKTILAKPKYICLLVGPSGHGKSHLLESLVSNWVSDVDVDEDESETVAFEKLLQRSLVRNPLKNQRVAIHCIENLDTHQKRTLSSFLKKHKEHPGIQLVLTSDSLWDAPTSTLKKDPLIQTVLLNEYSAISLCEIVKAQALETFDMTLTDKSVLNLCEHARGNPRAALQAFDFAARTKRGTSSKFESDRDCPMDIFKYVPSLVRGRPLLMDLESSDLFFATMLTFENSTIHRDHLEMIDIVSKRFLLDAPSTQAFLELPFKVKPQYMEGRMRMLGPSKKKSIRDAAHWPDDLLAMKPSELDAHDRLHVLNAHLAGQKTLTKKHPMYHEDADIRDLRKKSLFSM